MGRALALRAYLEELDKRNDLARIDCACSPTLEIGEIAHRVMSQRDGGKALLFSNTGTPFPLAINLYGSAQRMLTALRCSSYEELAQRIDEFIDTLTAQPKSLRSKLALMSQFARLSRIVPKRSRRAAPCQEVVMEMPDLTKLPALKCWPADAAPFITLPMVITEHPTTGIRNVGMYRMQIIDSTHAAMHWHVHKTGAAHYRAYQAMGKPMPIAVALGGDPLLAYCATAPLPEGVDEWLMAGFLRGKRVRLAAAKTVPLLVPAEADFIIEGYVDTSQELFLEGPFGDHTGFYSLPDFYPTLRVTAITHRRDAIYPATIVGVPPMEDAQIALATERIFNVPLRKTLAPEIVSFSLPTAGVAHNLSVAAVRNLYPAQAERLANLFWSTGQLMFTKYLLVVDEVINPSDWRVVLYLAAKAAHDHASFYHGYGPLDVLDHSSPKPCEGGKLLLDARGIAVELTRDDKLSLQEKTLANGHRVGLLSLGSVDVACVVPTHDAVTPLHGLAQAFLEGISAPFVVFVDANAPWRNPYLLLWLTLANCAPDVDMHHVRLASGGDVLLCDARMKCGWPGRRPWPNPVASDSSTIKGVDEKWPVLGLGDFITSPSLVVKGYQMGEDAVAKR